MSHAASLAAAFAAAPQVTTPFSFLHTVTDWLTTAGQAFLATDEQRKAAHDTIMGVYDSLAASLGKSNAMVGALFGMFRGMVDGAVTALLDKFKPPAPVPVVVPTPTPQGSAAP